MEKMSNIIAPLIGNKMAKQLKMAAKAEAAAEKAMARAQQLQEEIQA